MMPTIAPLYLWLIIGVLTFVISWTFLTTTVRLVLQEFFTEQHFHKDNIELLFQFRKQATLLLFVLWVFPMASLLLGTFIFLISEVG